MIDRPLLRSVVHNSLVIEDEHRGLPGSLVLEELIAPSTDRAESASLTDPSDQPVVARSAGHDPHRRFERQNSFSNATCMVYVFGRLPVIGNSQLYKKNQLSAMWNRVPGPRLNSVLRRAPPSRGTAKLVSR